MNDKMGTDSDMVLVRNYEKSLEYILYIIPYNKVLLNLNNLYYIL